MKTSIPFRVLQFRTWMQKQISLREPEQAVQKYGAVRTAEENLLLRQEQRRVDSSAGQQAVVMRNL